MRVRTRRPRGEGARGRDAHVGRGAALAGADIAPAFRRLDLIGEYRIYVHPVLSRRGKPLLQPMEGRTQLRLAEVRRFGNGVVLLRHLR